MLYPAGAVLCRADAPQQLMAQYCPLVHEVLSCVWPDTDPPPQFHWGVTLNVEMWGLDKHQRSELSERHVRVQHHPQSFPYGDVKQSCMCSLMVSLWYLGTRTLRFTQVFLRSDLAWWSSTHSPVATAAAATLIHQAKQSVVFPNYTEAEHMELTEAVAAGKQHRTALCPEERTGLTPEE